MYNRQFAYGCRNWQGPSLRPASSKSQSDISRCAMATSAFPACFNAHGVLTTPDGSFSFVSSSGKSKAEIQFAKVGDDWIAEYRFRFLCGLYHGSTLPLSVSSEAFSVQGKAIVHAARRLMTDIQAKCGMALRCRRCSKPNWQRCALGWSRRSRPLSPSPLPARHSSTCLPGLAVSISP